MCTTLRERLRAIRRERGITQPALAELSGVSRETISLIERADRHDPRLSVMTALSRALDEPHLLCDAPCTCDALAS